MVQLISVACTSESSAAVEADFLTWLRPSANSDKELFRFCMLPGFACHKQGWAEVLMWDSTYHLVLNGAPGLNK